jgi:folylpolyglutamate synthase
LALHAFIREGVDAAIIETHHGGEYDSTNVVQKPIVTCVTTLGLDHVEQLGSSLESIAWHKAGIFKPGVRAVAAPTVPEATSMLQNRAVEKGAALEFAERDPALPEGAIQIKPDILRTNCSVAISATRAFLEETAGEKPSPLSDTDIIEGIKQWSWPGRFQIEIEGQNTWYLDGAHNDISLTAAAEWFLSHAQSSASPKILIFAQISHVRKGGPVVECLARALQGKVNHVIFTTYRRDEDSPEGRSEKEFNIDDLQKVYVETWKQIHPTTEILVERTIESALEAARRIGKEGGDGGMQTLITGSQHLVGPAFALIQLPPAE